MSRRALSLLLLATLSAFAAACAEPVAPLAEDTTEICRGGWTGSGARCGQ